MPPTEIDIIQLLSNAGIMVRFVLLLLLFFSVTSWAIIIIKWRYIRRAYVESNRFIEYFWKSRDLAGAYTKAKQLGGCPVARIFRVGYVELKRVSQSGGIADEAGRGGDSISGRFSGGDNVKRALRRAISTETTRMTQMVPFLATTGNTTPFIGLFGTVWGIMNSFHGIGLRGFGQFGGCCSGNIGSADRHRRRAGRGYSGCYRLQLFYAENQGDRV
jgi:biopolymer transport protein TolQ